MNISFGTFAVLAVWTTVLSLPGNAQQTGSLRLKPSPTPDSVAGAFEPGSSLVASYAAWPVIFEANRGQASQGVQFLARGSGHVLYLRKNGLAIRFGQLDSSEIDLQFTGTNLSAAAVGEEPLSARTNYLVGNAPARWVVDLPNYARVRYPKIYPGIDLVFYGNQRQLEYDFVIAPGAPIGSIVLALRRPHHALSRDAWIDPATGDLVVENTKGTLRLQQPVAYQQVDGRKRTILSRFRRLAGNRFGFVVGAYDRRLPLTIDPVLGYATFLGGADADAANAIAVDGKGAVYVTGSTSSTNFPTKNPLQAADKGSSTAFVSKISPSGELIYSTYLGGTGGDVGYGIAVDEEGNAYVAGATLSTDFPVKNPIQSTNHGSSNAFVAKLDQDGSSLDFSTYLGGSPSGDPLAPCPGDFASAIALDRQLNIYLTGQACSTDFPVVDAVQAQNNSADFGGNNAFVTKIDASGTSLVYSTYLGGSGNFIDDGLFFPIGGDIGSGIAVGEDGEAVVVGSTFSTDFPVYHALQTGNNADYSGPPIFGGVGSNGFVTKYAADGSSYVFSTYLGGSGDPYMALNMVFAFGDVASAVAIDEPGNIYVTGATRSSDFPLVNAIQSRFLGANHGNTQGLVEINNTNAFVTKYKSDGSAYLFSTYLGGVGVDSCTLDQWQDDDCPVGEVGEFGVPEYNGDNATGIAVGPNHTIFVAGYTGSLDFPLHSPVQNSNHAAAVIGPNAFVTEMADGGSTIRFSTYFGGSTRDQAAGVAVDENGNVYVAGSTSSADMPTTRPLQPNFGSKGDAFVFKIIQYPECVEGFKIHPKPVCPEGPVLEPPRHDRDEWSGSMIDVPHQSSVPRRP